MTNQTTRRGSTQEGVNAVNQNKSHSREFLSGIFNTFRCQMKGNSLLNKCVKDPPLQPLGMTALFNNNQETGDPRQNSSGMTPHFINGKCTDRGFTAHSVTPQCRYAGYSRRIGFTLIELLVVVLIIGILAAVALPQYQLAVASTRGKALLPLLKSIDQAERLYYMQHGTYVKSYAALDIQMPAGTKQTSDTAVFFEGWTCYFQLGDPQSHKCTTEGVILEQYFGSQKTICWAKKDSIFGNKICQSVSQKRYPILNSSGTHYSYVWSCI